MRKATSGARTPSKQAMETESFTITLPAPLVANLRFCAAYLGQTPEAFIADNTIGAAAVVAESAADEAARFENKSRALAARLNTPGKGVRRA